MVAQVLPVIGNLISAVLDLFFDVINRLGAFGLVFGAFIVLTIHRFLLVPIIGGVVGGARSDMVKSVRQKGGSSLDQDGKAGKGVK